jgi:hypothetical protein
MSCETLFSSKCYLISSELNFLEKLGRTRHIEHEAMLFFFQLLNYANYFRFLWKIQRGSV